MKQAVRSYVAFEFQLKINRFYNHVSNSSGDRNASYENEEFLGQNRHRSSSENAIVEMPAK